MTHQPFTAYKQKDATWGFFIDEECERFYSPFDNRKSAQAKADWLKDSLQKPERFTQAWERAIAWLADRGCLRPEFFIEQFSADKPTRYQDMPPQFEAFKEVVGLCTGVAAFAVQMYSFYNTSAAIKLAGKDARLLTPWAAGALIDEEGRQIIIDLTSNYSGW